jgi:hypothetical protein
VAQFIQYTCQHEMLPSIEALLAANGYAVITARQTSSMGTTSVAMQCNATVVLLMYNPMTDVTELEVWGSARGATTDLLQSLPFTLHRQPYKHPH